MTLSLVTPAFSKYRREGLWNVFAAHVPLLATLALGFYFYVATALSPHFALVVLLGIALISFVLWPRFALCLLLAGMLFQYFWIGVFMDSVTDDNHLRLLSLTNPLVTNLLFVCAFVYLVNRWRILPDAIKKTCILGAVFVVISLVYAVLGAARESFESAFQYFRNYSGILIYFVLGAAFGLRLSLQSIFKLFVPFGVMLAVYGFVEIFFPYDLYLFVHLTDYFHMKFADISTNRQELTFYGIEDTITFLTVPFLNLSGDFGLNIKSLRLVGPIFHFISYGYAMAFFFLVAIMAERRLAALLMIPVFLMIGAKGALVMVFFALLTLAITRITRKADSTLSLLSVILVVYTLLVLVYGFLSHDNHFDGLLSCVSGFLSNPLGHGVGVGGNMSDTSVAAIQGGQNILASTENFPAESALGVLMYQAGIAGLAAFIFFWRFIMHKTRSVVLAVQEIMPQKSAMIILPATLSVLLVNAIFQEEIFTPTGWGLWLILVGAVLASTSNEKNVPVVS